MLRTVRRATFLGKHNHTKALVLVCLLQRSRDDLGGISCRELSHITGVPYGSLASLLCRWHKWKYVTRRPSTSKNGLVYSYHIASKGIFFVNVRIPRPVIESVTQELDDLSRRRNKPNRKNWVSLSVLMKSQEEKNNGGKKSPCT